MNKNLLYSALILAGIIATGGLAFSLGPVPITFQIFFVIFAGLFLPVSYSYVPMAIYLFMGAVGLPVFAGFSSGFEHFISPTGGYLLSFPFASLLISYLHRNSEDTPLKLFFISLAGLSVVYGLGLFVLTFYTKSFLLSLKLGFIPFILVDIAKIFVVIFVYERVKKAISITIT
jgi:biotin transport system substrate-specific component